VSGAMHGCEAVINLAAETHVDRSLQAAGSFVETDVLGTHVLLEQARAAGVSRFLQVSTDEVYGHLPSGRAAEDAPLRPRSPYSASKAGGDLLCQAYHESFELPVLITRGSNTYGPNQFPEKIIPLFITNALDGEALPLYGDGSAVRDYIHVSDHAEAILTVFLNGVPGQVYNAGTGSQVSGLQVAEAVLALTGRGRDLISHVEDRPGHDYRYALDASRLRALGWEARVTFAEGLDATVRWYRDNEAWWRPLKTGEYLEFYRRNYRPLVQRPA
jgi:dTDP-glucose 4,6-dehydratase